MAPTLYGFWRSSCSWRVRIALKHKNIPHSQHFVHLKRNGGEQLSTAHQHRNTMAQIPVLAIQSEQHGEIFISQSMAILEYLEDQYPTPSMYPRDIIQRTRARQVSEVVNAGIQPLQNGSTMRAIEALGHDKTSWAKSWIQKGLDNLERMVSTFPKTPFLVSNKPSIADFCLIPQLYNARRFGCKTDHWSRLMEAEDKCFELSAFVESHPDRQPDAPKALPEP